MEYKEIFRLKEMLNKANIPFEYKNRGWELPYYYRLTIEFHQIGYPNLNLNERVCSVVEGDGTFGADADRLEIMGLLTDEEYEDSCVLGGLTAEEVFERISKHYKG